MNLNIPNVYYGGHTRKNSFGLADNEARFNDLYEGLKRIETGNMKPEKRFVFAAKTGESPIRQRQFADIMIRIVSDAIDRSNSLSLSYSRVMYSIVKSMFKELTQSVNDLTHQSPKHNRNHSNNHSKKRVNGQIADNYNKLLMLLFQWQCIMFTRKQVRLESEFEFAQILPTIEAMINDAAVFDNIPMISRASGNSNSNGNGNGNDYNNRQSESQSQSHMSAETATQLPYNVLIKPKRDELELGSQSPVSPFTPMSHGSGLDSPINNKIESNLQTINDDAKSNDENGKDGNDDDNDNEDEIETDNEHKIGNPRRDEFFDDDTEKIYDDDDLFNTNGKNNNEKIEISYHSAIYQNSMMNSNFDPYSDEHLHSRDRTINLAKRDEHNTDNFLSVTNGHGSKGYQNTIGSSSEYADFTVDSNIKMDMKSNVIMESDDELNGMGDSSDDGNGGNGDDDDDIIFEIDIGDRFQLKDGTMGTVKFAGGVGFADGMWFGIELDNQFNGKNDGSVKGVNYFKCKKTKGVFLSAKQMKKAKRLNDDSNDNDNNNNNNSKKKDKKKKNKDKNKDKKDKKDKKKNEKDNRKKDKKEKDNKGNDKKKTTNDTKNTKNTKISAKEKSVKNVKNGKTGKEKEKEKSKDKGNNKKQATTKAKGKNTTDNKKSGKNKK